MKLLSKTLLIITASFVFIPAYAEEAWPNHPVKFIVGFGPGGANDLVARVVAEGVSKQLNQTVIVENKPGAGSKIGERRVGKEC